MVSRAHEALCRAPSPSLHHLLHPHAPAIHLELQVAHRRPGEVPVNARMGRATADNFICEERIDVADRVDLARGGVPPADAEKAKSPRDFLQHEMRLLPHRLGAVLAASGSPRACTSRARPPPSATA